MAERDDLFLEEVDEDVYLMASHEEIPEYNETETDASGSDEVAAEPLPTLESDAAETWPAQEEPHLNEERSEPKAEEESVESAAFPIQPEDDLDDFLEGVDELEELDSMS